jgi:hypothetical protein
LSPRHIMRTAFHPILEEIGRESAAFTHSVLVGLPLVVYVLT